MNQARAGKNRGETLTLTCEVTKSFAPSVTPRRSRFGPYSQSGVNTPVVPRPLPRHDDGYTPPGPMFPPRQRGGPPPSPTPRFLDDPCVHAPLFDPGGPPAPGHYGTGDVAFRWIHDVGSALCLSRLHHTACTLSVYASQPGSPPDRATLDSGWWPALAGRGSHPLGRVEGFRHVYPST